MLYKAKETYGKNAVANAKVEANNSQNLDEGSLARASTIFAIARMLGFLFKFGRFLKIRNHVKPATFALSTQNIVNSSSSPPGEKATSGKFELNSLGVGT